MKKFSVIIPVYGNEKNIPITVPYIMEKRSLFSQYEFELIMVCDGSPDNSYSEMKKCQRQYPGEIKIVKFTRNFGQGAAVHCGLDIATGDVIGVISCDLQDPFELFVDMLEAWEQGHKIVIATRQFREEKGIGAWCSKAFHSLIHNYVDKRYPRGGFDFFLVDKEVAKEYIKIDQANGNMQMGWLWLGYDYYQLLYTRKKREIGKSSWKFPRKINAASGLIATYSKLFNRVWGFIGLIISAVSLVLSIILIIMLAIIGLNMYLFVSLATLIIIFIVGIGLCAVASIGEYIWRSYDILLDHPRYVIDEIIE